MINPLALECLNIHNNFPKMMGDRFKERNQIRPTHCILLLSNKFQADEIEKVSMGIEL